MSDFPKFKTDVKDLDTASDAREVFDDFTRDLSKEDLFQMAELYVLTRLPNSSIYSFAAMQGGLMRFIISVTVSLAVESEIAGVGQSLLDKLMSHYEFTAETIPPRMLMREAVAAQVRLSSILSDIRREFPNYNASPVWVVANAAEKLATTEEAFKLSDEETDRILQGLD